MYICFSITDIQWKTSKSQSTSKIKKMNNIEKERKKKRERRLCYLFNKLYFPI